MSDTNPPNQNLTNTSDLKSTHEEQPIVIETQVELNPEENSQTPPEKTSPPIRKKKRWVWGVRTKATLLVMAIGTLPVFAVGGVASFLSNEFMYMQVAVSQINQVNELQDKIHLYMKDRFADIKVMAELDIFTHPQWRERATREEKDQVLMKIQKAYDIYDSIAVFDMKGNVVAQTVGTPLKNPLNRTYIQAALKADGPVIAQPSISPTTGTFSVYTASVIKDPDTGELLGFIRARIPVKELENIIYNQHSEEENFYLINREGKVFVGPEGEYDPNELSSGGEVESPKEELAAIDINKIFPKVKELEQESQAVVTLANNLKLNSQKLIAYAPPMQMDGLPDLNWRAIISAEPDVAFNPQYQLLLFFLWGTGATVVLVGFVTILIANRATRSILKSSEVVKKFGQGDLDQRVPVAGEDEIGELGSNINTMAQQIQDLLLEQEAAVRRQQEEQAKYVSQQEEIAQQEKERSEQLQRELVKFLTEVESASDGDLTVRADISAGEIGIVADFFNSIVESLRDVVSRVKDTATQVNTSISSNEGSIQELANVALTQASQISQTLNSVEEMSHSIQAVADNAKAAAAVAKTASTTAEIGGADMEQTVSNIFQLRETVAETTKKVKRLGESSQQISKAVSLINQIALQTNLLAINASIEAARAGEEGRGFAVVAEEVGQLAAQSASATKEIEKIVESIQQETSAVVEAMELGTTQVVEGTHLAEKTKASLGQIVDVSRQIDELLQSISQATVSQANTSQSVTQLMEEVAKISQQTSDSSRKVSSSLQETVTISQQLQESMETFKVS
ncbi:methyl-accepting chemotaxis protein [Crocosphaera sp. Alani8]|uniref:methyl-accepting chemotaxis protein n=1 Tax=Crocosphaera sp. Alani8 TaxID=3038952 RepID=UPI00313D7766